MVMSASAAAKKVPSKEDWTELREQIEEWYRKHTAQWIADEMGRNGLKVT
jgi:hypothetical protein